MQNKVTQETKDEFINKFDNFIELKKMTKGNLFNS